MKSNFCIRKKIKSLKKLIKLGILPSKKRIKLFFDSSESIAMNKFFKDL